MKQSKTQKKPNTLRIIGGSFRGRKITFPEIHGLRPTPDRVRETLFNWLAPIVQNSYCLDLFAGSGALGFEALSRGAAHVTFTDNATQVVNQLRANLKLLNIQNADVYQLAIPNPLPSILKPVDIVFLDPPFHQELVAPVCSWLEQSSLLKTEAYIYIEQEKNSANPILPNNWNIIKEDHAGQVRYFLVLKSDD